ncbi:porphobilinogen synthase [Clostridium sp. D2Q-11]|uniref:Delta-aminolevulinic acid dehydratase n=1 Tax=Anaeromonas frigoriresistens TaxID=2683708 RepID=A0A942Z7D9_9FIRM|nr:porphobilinogen synthase [Anaeromonas frigoriresistens]MBS4538582.1 porphobilinogen synthase [Anaeromonas frigoriresistens]
MKIIKRPRRLRSNSLIRELIKETRLQVEDLVYPLFVVEGENIKKEISSLPGNYHFSIDKLIEEIDELEKLGIKYIMLFGIPNKKDEIGSQAYSKDGIVQKAIRSIKQRHKDIYIITDICLCQYTDHGHCGILEETGYVNNDETLEYLSKIAVSHAEAGADMVAPSDMMDGRIGHMRRKLDEDGYVNLPIMSYSIKYSSSFYGPFRDAAHSAPSFGDRKTYQMDPANPSEALREVQLDIEEGADIVMVKPALAYLDIIRKVKDKYDVPMAAYNVSGEYAMLKMAIKNDLLSEEAIYESLLSIKRAGADIIITYFAKEIAQKLKERY